MALFISHPSRILFLKMQNSGQMTYEKGHSSVQNFVSEDAERVVYSFLIYLFVQISLYSGGF